MLEMSLSDWHDVPPCARQRDTERRALWAVNNHLGKYHKVHDFVKAATIKGNVACKLDGHTRDYLWSSGQLDPPPSGRVEVSLIAVADLDEAKQIYEYLDSPAAVKKPCDFLFGYTREGGFQLTSPLLRRCQFAHQLRYATANLIPKGAMELGMRFWREEFLDLDALNLSDTYTRLIAAMLVSVLRDGIKTAGTFWKHLDDNAGTKDPRGADGVEALTQHVRVRKAEGRMSGYDNVADLQDRAWTCYEAYLEGRRLKAVKPTDFRGVLAAVVVPKFEKFARRKVS